MSEQRSELSSYMTRLLSGGRRVFSREEAQEALGVGRLAFLKAAERQQRRGLLVNPRRGFYVIVSPEHLVWGAPPPAWYIDSLMRHENCPYYVGLLKAADFHGAAHQAVMEFQVVTDRQLSEITVGRSRIVFYYRKNMEAVAGAIEERNTQTGTMKLASVELTVLDLLRYPRAGGGFDNIATVVRDLSGQINPRKLSEVAAAFERPVIQRLGYLLDSLAERDVTRPLFAAVSQGSALSWTELQPGWNLDSELTPEPIERNKHWRVIVRHRPEPDW